MQLLTAGKYNVATLAFAPNGAALIACCNTHKPLLWELPATGSPVPLADKATYSCESFTFSPDASAVGWITGNERLEHDRRTGTVRAVALVPENERLCAQDVCGPDGRLVVRTIEHGSGFRIRAFTPNRRGEWTEAWVIGPTNHGGVRMAGTARGDRFFTWEVTVVRGRPTSWLVARSSLTGEALAEVAAPLNYSTGFTVRSDGTAVVAYKDSSLYYWRPGEKLEKVRTGTLKHYRDLAFHSDGRHLLAGNNDTTARLIDTATWQVVRQYTWAIGRLTAVAVSPDGQLAAAGGAKGQVVVWDLDL
jgi:WD40 repeat protein